MVSSTNRGFLGWNKVNDQVVMESAYNLDYIHKKIENKTAEIMVKIIKNQAKTAKLSKKDINEIEEEVLDFPKWGKDPLKITGEPTKALGGSRSNELNPDVIAHYNRRGFLLNRYGEIILLKLYYNLPKMRKGVIVHEYVHHLLSGDCLKKLNSWFKIKYALSDLNEGIADLVANEITGLKIHYVNEVKAVLKLMK